MSSFLNDVARRIIAITDKEGIDSGQLAVVVPTRRSTLFLKKSIASIIEKPVWLPGIFSLDDFITEITPYQIREEFFLITELYHCYSKVIGGEDLVSFYQWGKIILRDFDEIDRNLVDAGQFFATLKDARELESWEPGEGNDAGREQERYWRKVADRGESKSEYSQYFWKSLKKIYLQFRESLIKKESCYPGMAFGWLPKVSGINRNRYRISTCCLQGLMHCRQQKVRLFTTWKKWEWQKACGIPICGT